MGGSSGVSDIYRRPFTQEIFDVLKDYVISEGITKRLSYQTAKRKIELFINDAEKHPTTYTKDLIIAFNKI